MRAAPAVFALALFLPAGTGPPGAPPPAGRQEAGQKPLRHEVTVALKLVQVSVTDRKGRPVTDLKRDEFEVTDDGRPVEVTHFEAPGSEETRAATAGGPARGTPEAATRLSRKFYLVFDFSSLDQNGLVKARGAALRLLDEALRPDDQIALVSYSPARGLTVHEHLTTDHEAVRRVVAAFGAGRLAGRAESYFARYLGQLEEARQVGTPESDYERSTLTDPFVRGLVASRTDPSAASLRAPADYVARVFDYLSTLRGLAVATSGVPGTKNVVLFSAGIPRELIYGKRGGAPMDLMDFSNWEQFAEKQRAYDASHAEGSLRDAYQDMLEAFKASDGAVFAFNVARARGAADVESQGGAALAVYDLTGEESLLQFAGATGGKYFSNTTDPGEAVEDIRGLTAATYVLGFAPAEGAAGAFHKLKISVTRRGLRARAPRGYFGAKPFARYTALEKILHLFDLALGESPEFAIPVEIPFLVGHVRDGGRDLAAGAALVAGEETEALLGPAAEACVLLFDERGELVGSERARLPEAGPDRGSRAISFALPVRPGWYSCRLVVRDTATGKAARATAELAVVEAAGGGLWLDPVLFLAEAEGAAASRVGGGPDLPGLYGYDAARFRPLVEPAPAGTSRLTAAARLTGAAEKADLSFVAFLFDEAAKARRDVPVTIAGRTRAGPADVFRLELSTGPLAPGTYGLDLIVQAAGGADNAHGSASLIVC